MNDKALRAEWPLLVYPDVRDIVSERLELVANHLDFGSNKGSRLRIGVKSGLGKQPHRRGVHTDQRPNRILAALGTWRILVNIQQASNGIGALLRVGQLQQCTNNCVDFIGIIEGFEVVPAISKVAGFNIVYEQGNAMCQFAITDQI